MSLAKRAKVTVNCFVFDAATVGYIYLSTDGTVDTQFGGVAYNDTVTVEYLPEPVTFKVGDVVRVVRGHSVYVRMNDVWLMRGWNVEYTDAQVEEWLAQGRVVRLVPEVKPL